MMKSPFDQGSQAFADEMPTSICQFAEGSTMQRQWVEGWSHRQVLERALRKRSIGLLFVQDAPLAGELAALEKVRRPVHSVS